MKRNAIKDVEDADNKNLKEFKKINALINYQILTNIIKLIKLNLVPQVKVLSGKYRHNTSNYWELGFALCAGNAEMGLLCQNHMQSMKKEN